MDDFGRTILFVMTIIGVIISIPGLIIGIIGWHIAKKTPSHSNNISLRDSIIIICLALGITLLIIGYINSHS